MFFSQECNFPLSQMSHVPIIYSTPTTPTYEHTHCFLLGSPHRCARRRAPGPRFRGRGCLLRTLGSPRGRLVRTGDLQSVFRPLPLSGAAYFYEPLRRCGPYSHQISETTEGGEGDKGKLGGGRTEFGPWRRLVHLPDEDRRVAVGNRLLRTSLPPLLSVGSHCPFQVQRLDGAAATGATCRRTRRISPRCQSRMRGPQVPAPRPTSTVMPPTS